MESTRLHVKNTILPFYTQSAQVPRSRKIWINTNVGRATFLAASPHSGNSVVFQAASPHSGKFLHDLVGPPDLIKLSQFFFIIESRHFPI